MISVYKHKKLTWVDLELPTPDEVKELMRKYSIHPLIAEELLKPSIRTKVDTYKNSIYLILRFPIFEQDKKTSVSYEMDFVIGKNFLITAHYKPITPLYEITKIFEVGSMLGEDYLIKNTGVLVFFIIRQLYDFALRQLEHIQKKIEKIEENIFRGREQEMVETISLTHRDMLDFQRAIHAHESILDSLQRAGEKFFGYEFTHYGNKMKGELLRIKSLLQASMDTIKSLQTTNDSLLTDKTNSIMKMLTLMAFITFPLMLFSSIFSMNTTYTPILGARGDFWIILSLMLVSMTTMIFVFKRKKWF